MTQENNTLPDDIVRNNPLRLLRMAVEFLTNGVLQVERQDAAELLAIKRGEWTLNQVKTEAELLFSLAEEAYNRSALPEQSDREKINRLCTEMLEMRFAPINASF